MALGSATEQPGCEKEKPENTEKLQGLHKQGRGGEPGLPSDHTVHISHLLRERRGEE